MEQQPPPAQTPPPVQAGLNLFLIAENHRALMQAVLLMLLAILCHVGAGMFPPEVSDPIGLVMKPAPASAVLSIIGMVIQLLGIVRAIIAVAKIKSSMGDGMVSIVLCCIGLILPCISLIILLVISQSVVGIMKNQGISVGLMGVNSEELEKLKHRAS